MGDAERQSRRTACHETQSRSDNRATPAAHIASTSGSQARIRSGQGPRLAAGKSAGSNCGSTAAAESNSPGDTAANPAAAGNPGPTIGWRDDSAEATSAVTAGRAISICQASVPPKAATATNSAPQARL